MTKSQTRSQTDLQALRDLLIRAEEREQTWRDSLSYEALIYSLNSQELIWGPTETAKLLSGLIGDWLMSSGLPAGGILVMACTPLDDKVARQDAAAWLGHLWRSRWIRKSWHANDQNMILEGAIITDSDWQRLAHGRFLKNHARVIVTEIRRLIEQQFHTNISDLSAKFSDLTVPEIRQFVTSLDGEARAQLAKQLVTVGEELTGGPAGGDELKLLLEKLTKPTPPSTEELNPQALERQAHEIELAAMSLRVFGREQPSVEGFTRYVEQVRIESQKPSTLEWKREECRVINFWKRYLGRQFVYQGTPCTLTTKPTRNGQGRFVLRTAGALQHDLRLPGLKEKLPEFDIQGS